MPLLEERLFCFLLSRFSLRVFLHHGEVRSQVQCGVGAEGKNRVCLELSLLQQRETSLGHREALGVGAEASAGHRICPRLVPDQTYSWGV